MKKIEPPFYQIEAFRRRLKPGLYEVFSGKFVNGRVRVRLRHRPWLAWYKYWLEFNELLQEYPYVYAEREMGGEIVYAFYVYHENNFGITTEVLRNYSRYHEEIGRAIGIPEFAAKEFAKRKEPKQLYRVKIEKLGLVFTMEKKEKNLEKLTDFWKCKGLQESDIKIE